MDTALLAILLVVFVPLTFHGLVSYWRRTRVDDVASGNLAEAQRRYLVSNWSDVEEAAARSGMEADQIAAVRRKLLGV